MEYTCYPDMIHGFLAMGDVLPAAQQALGGAARSLRAACCAGPMGVAG